MEKEKKRQYEGQTEDRELEAKLLVHKAVRAGSIEDIHAGKHMDIPKEASRITDDEMKKIMMDAVDEIHFLLWLRDTKPEIYKAWYEVEKYFYGNLKEKWNKPKDPNIMLDEIMKYMNILKETFGNKKIY